MNQFLPFIVIGLATGAVYGLAGMGVVITFKTSGILNFGYGSVAALDAGPTLPTSCTRSGTGHGRMRLWCACWYLRRSQAC